MVLLRMSFICLLVISTALPTTAAEPTTPGKPSPADYWAQIQTIAIKQFSGIALNPVVSTDYQFSGDNAGPRIGVSLDLPLWDKGRKQKERENAVNFMRTGAQLIRQLQISIANIELYNKKSGYLKALVKEEGIAGVNALFDNKNSIIEQQALEIQYRREIESLIKPFVGSKPVRVVFQNTGEKVN